MNSAAESLAIAIIGYGVVGQKRHSAVMKFRGATVVAVCDQDCQKTKNVSSKITCVTDYNELFGLSLDVAFICLSNDMNARISKIFLDRGVHVFCEKPPARNLRELMSVRQLAIENPSLKLGYGFNHRYHRSVQKAVSLVQSGILGDPLHARCIYGKSHIVTFNQSDWRTKRAIAGGGVLLDQGIHMVDLLLLMFGNLDIKSSIVTNSFWGFDVEDNVYSTMKTESGCVVMFHSSATHWKHKFLLELHFKKGSITLDGLVTGSRSYGEEKIEIAYVPSEDYKADLVRESFVFGEDISWEEEVNYFLNCVISGSNVENGSIDDAFRALKTVQEIYYECEEWRNFYSIENPREFYE